MAKFIIKFEQLITTILMLLMVLVVTMTVADLAWLLFKDAITSPVLILDTSELLDIFSMFLLVLVGIELVETLKIYVFQHEIRTEIIILVAIIALARKIITLDLKEVSNGSLLGVAAIMLSLSIAYYVIKGGRISGIKFLKNEE
ncbi:MAG: phosphate-starvation-inducible PsiE family protein [Bacteriovorax sp.]|nr:phosphate-starvation-inducible PsiE family protein [Bacteriovorax sp.]